MQSRENTCDSVGVNEISISLNVFILLASIELQIFLNLSSGQPINTSNEIYWLGRCQLEAWKVSEKFSIPKKCTVCEVDMSKLISCLISDGKILDQMVDWGFWGSNEVDCFHVWHWNSCFFNGYRIWNVKLSKILLHLSS